MVLADQKAQPDQRHYKESMTLPHKCWLIKSQKPDRVFTEPSWGLFFMAVSITCVDSCQGLAQ